MLRSELRRAQPGCQPASPDLHWGGKEKLLYSRSLRILEIGPGGGRRKYERFRPESEMRENTDDEVKCKAEGGRETRVCEYSQRELVVEPG